MSTSDELNSLNHTGDLPDELHPLDADLHRRLLSDGAQWRAGLPSAETLAARVAALARPAAGATDRRREDTAVTDRIPPAVTDVPATPTLPPAHRGPWTGLRGAIAATVAVAVVLLFVFVIHGAPGGGNTAGNGKPTSTPPTSAARATATALPPAQWTAMPGLSNLPGMPVIAPSDPRVVYVADGATLKRSEDDGATWHTLQAPASFPAGVTYSWVDLAVSPLDAKTVLATAQLNLTSTAACASAQQAVHIGALAQFGGSVPCNLQLVSTDGGQTWARPKTDFPQLIGNASADRTNWSSPNSYSAPPQAGKGGTLYDLAGYGPQAGFPSYRIVRSANGGVTWYATDQELTAAGLNICDFAVSDTDNRLYAIVSTQRCSVDAPPPVQLWRSDDGGAHWQQASLPTQGLSEGMVVTNGTLYIAMGTPSGQAHVGGATVGPTSFLATSDGGQTWTTSPAHGVPSGVTVPFAVVAGASGGVIASFVSGSGNGQATLGAGWPQFFGWVAGEPYWKATPQEPLPAQGVTTLLVTTDAKSGRLTLWVVAPAATNQPGSQLSYTVYR